MTGHVPLCFNCDAREVQEPHTYADGTGFCSAECERTANAEFAAHFDEVDGDTPDCVDCGHPAETVHPEGAPMCRVCWSHEDEDHYIDQKYDSEPEGSYDLSDDGDALASAGFGTDEDYGYYGDDY